MTAPTTGMTPEAARRLRIVLLISSVPVVATVGFILGWVT